MSPEEEKTHLTQKIEQVKFDIEQLRQTGSADKKLETLSFYLEYLEDELKMLKDKLKNVNRS